MKNLVFKILVTCILFPGASFAEVFNVDEVCAKYNKNVSIVGEMNKVAEKKSDYGCNLRIYCLEYMPVNVKVYLQCDGDLEYYNFSNIKDGFKSVINSIKYEEKKITLTVLDKKISDGKISGRVIEGDLKNHKSLEQKVSNSGFYFFEKDGSLSLYSITTCSNKNTFSFKLADGCFAKTPIK